MTQEAVAKTEITEPLNTTPSLKQLEKKRQFSIQEIVESLKSTADDIGQITELNSEEKILVAELFSSLLRLMQPLATSIPVNKFALPAQLSDVVRAYVDPTGHLILQFEDSRIELKDLSDERNRDLMMTIVGDILPKFKTLTSNQKTKLENRIKFLSSITKEIQKSSEALSEAISISQ